MRRLILATLLCLPACTQQGLIDRFASRQEQALALQIADEVRAGQVDRIAQRTLPELRPQIPAAMKQVAPMIEPVRGPFRIETVEKVAVVGGPTTMSFNVQAGDGDHWAVVQMTLRRTGAKYELLGFYVTPVASDPSRINDFSVGRRGAVGFAWLAAMLLCVGSCIWAVVLIWRRRWLKRRWLWTVGSLLGIGKFTLNWSTGAWGMWPINVQLLGAAGLRASVYAPWLFSFSVPLVALIVIARWYLHGRKAASTTD